MQLLKHACWLHCRPTIERYLMSNACGREDGAEKAIRHEELCRFYVAVVMKVDDVDLVRREYEPEYQAIHTKTQELTDYLDEVIGFPLVRQPDYDDLAPKFFLKFHTLALEALNVSVDSSNKDMNHAH